MALFRRYLATISFTFSSEGRSSKWSFTLPSVDFFSSGLRRFLQLIHSIIASQTSQWSTSERFSSCLRRLSSAENGQSLLGQSASIRSHSSSLAIISSSSLNGGFIDAVFLGFCMIAPINPISCCSGHTSPRRCDESHRFYSDFFP